ncbi:CidA/LrgA family protein [Siculibacillus lacustris]|uniref:CidA/LrgA family protein n=1 Tax=Siculibacillus lacustris TaxID=1549641 RepID=A0A4Q9VYJ1_9HYPH|nr:CidA/LrgA family protein [Siculibacillus lacustris]TBW41194.1 CidA/LrgA family protein [Siculibacillus lacustris]
MIRGFAILLLCQLVGEAIARGTGLPVPGPVLGFAGLVAALAWFDRHGDVDDTILASSDLGRVSNGLLATLSLLFVPAGVGVIQHLDVIGAQGLAITLALVISTAVTLAVTVGTFVAVKRLMTRTEEPRR